MILMPEFSVDYFDYVRFFFFFAQVNDEWHWEPVDKSFRLPLFPPGGIKEIINQYDLCITGEVSIRNLIFAF